MSHPRPFRRIFNRTQLELELLGSQNANSYPWYTASLIGICWHSFTFTNPNHDEIMNLELSGVFSRLYWTGNQTIWRLLPVGNGTKILITESWAPFPSVFHHDLWSQRNNIAIITLFEVSSDSFCGFIWSKDHAHCTRRAFGSPNRTLDWSTTRSSPYLALFPLVLLFYSWSILEMKRPMTTDRWAWSLLWSLKYPHDECTFTKDLSETYIGR